MDSQWISSMLNGTLRVGNAQYYRLLEVFTGDEWIGDSEEVRATGNTGAFSITPDSRDPNTLQMVEQNNIAIVPPGATFIVNQGVQIRHSVPCYIQSMSVGELSSLRPIMTDPARPRYSYNGCVEIIDIDALCQHLCSHGTIDGRPLSDFFTGIEHGAVRYSGQLNNPWAAKIEANPFLKAARYTSQSEYRIIFHSRREISGDHKIIRFPDARRFFRMSFENDGPASIQPSLDRRTKAEIIACLANIQALIKEKRQESNNLFIRREEDALEQSHRIQVEFEEDFSTNHLRPLLDAYWALRCHHPSQELDHALDIDLSASHLYIPLSQYLYGPHHMFWGNEFMWQQSSEREPEPCLFERLINDDTIPNC